MQTTHRLLLWLMIDLVKEVQYPCSGVAVVHDSSLDRFNWTGKLLGRFESLFVKWLASAAVADSQFVAIL